MWIKFIALCAHLGLFVLLPGCTLFPYPHAPSSEAFSGHVVDKETGEPLAGVNIVAHWPLMAGLEGNLDYGEVMVMETVSDQNGYFQFPAWSRFVFRTGIQKGATLILFKSNYSSITIDEEDYTGSREEWEKTLKQGIQMEKHDGSLDAAKDELPSFIGLMFA